MECWRVGSYANILPLWLHVDVWRPVATVGNQFILKSLQLYYYYDLYT